MLSLQPLVFCASRNAYEQDEILIKKDRNDTKVEIMTVPKEKLHGPPIYAIPGNDESRGTICPELQCKVKCSNVQMCRTVEGRCRNDKECKWGREERSRTV
jgi:hypothetical protein